MKRIAIAALMLVAWPAAAQAPVAGPRIVIKNAVSSDVIVTGSLIYSQSSDAPTSQRKLVDCLVAIAKLQPPWAAPLSQAACVDIEVYDANGTRIP